MPTAHLRRGSPPPAVGRPPLPPNPWRCRTPHSTLTSCPRSHLPTRNPQLAALPKTNARERTCVPKRSPSVQKRSQAGKISPANACARRPSRTPTHVRRNASTMRRNASQRWSFFRATHWPTPSKLATQHPPHSTALHRTCGLMRCQCGGVRIRAVLFFVPPHGSVLPGVLGRGRITRIGEPRP